MLIPVFNFEDKFTKIFPEARLGIFTSSVNVQESGTEILQWMDSITSKIAGMYKTVDIHDIPIIRQTRNAYKKSGKDPSRYRPSAEALARRIAAGKPLFKVNNIVDVLNVISIESGFSIGGYDLDKIKRAVRAGIGKENEPYEAIGRGVLNMQNLPLLYDDTGPFGCPTSDSVRTMINPFTTRYMMVLFDFEGKGNPEDVLKQSVEYYRKYCDLKDISTWVVSVE